MNAALPSLRLQRFEYWSSTGRNYHTTSSHNITWYDSNAYTLYATVDSLNTNAYADKNDLYPIRCISSN